MIDTKDLPSYILGYDEYCDPKRELEDDSWALSDVYYDEFMIRGGYEIMHRKVIDLNSTNLTIKDICKLNNYVWKNDKLIPQEKLINDKK